MGVCCGHTEEEQSHVGKEAQFKFLEEVKLD
jgi:hypothetical protein